MALAQYGDVVFNVISYKETFTNDITGQPVEKGANIADHIDHNPRTFSLELRIDDEISREKLEALSLSEDTYSFTTPDGKRVIDNLVISELSFNKDKTKLNGYKVSMSLKEILTQQQTTIPLSDLQEDEVQIDNDSVSDKPTNTEDSLIEENKPTSLVMGGITGIFKAATLPFKGDD